MQLLKRLKSLKEVNLNWEISARLFTVTISIFFAAAIRKSSLKEKRAGKVEAAVAEYLTFQRTSSKKCRSNVFKNK